MMKATPIIGDDIRFLLLGGNVIGENALLRFYVLHCVILPLVITMLIGVHFWRIRKDGGLSSGSKQVADGKRDMILGKNLGVATEEVLNDRDAEK